MNNLKVDLKKPFLNTFIISLKKSNETSKKVFVKEKVQRERFLLGKVILLIIDKFAMHYISFAFGS